MRSSTNANGRLRQTTTKGKSRSNGEGSIYKLKSGRWQAQVTVSSNGGKLLRKTRSAPSQAEARRKLQELQSEAKAGVNVDGHTTLAEYLESWTKNVLPSRAVSLKTIENYQQMLTNHVIPAIGSVKLTDLRAEHIDKMLRNMANMKLSRSTITRTKLVLSLALKHAEARDYIVKDYARLAIIPIAPTKESRAMTFEQVKVFQEASEGTRYEALWLTMLALGLRPGEVRGLSWADIDFETHRLNIRHSLNLQGKLEAEGKRELILAAPKTKKSKRTLDMPQVLETALKSHRARQAEEKLAIGDLWHDSGLVFTTNLGTGIDPANLRRAFSEVLAKTDLGHWHPHELRHTAISLLSAEGMRLEDIADMAGHSTTRMTENVYRHQVRESVSAHVEVMGRLLG